MNSLHDPRIASTLQSLHEAAGHDPEREARRPAGGEATLIRMGEMYLAVSPDEGRLLYLLARGSGARRIIEFGASFGISTTYLAAAARDTGGTLVTTEVHPDKCAATRRVLADAGLSEVTNLIEGDARQTLLDIEGPIGFVFLDGWKSMYLPMLEILLPKLETGALIVADNIDFADARHYAERVRTDDAFVSRTIGTQELSVYTGAA